MNKRLVRLKNIKKIIREEQISSQEKLLDKLGKEGIKVTQATLSRDLRALKVSKKNDHQSTYYVLPIPSDDSLQAYIQDFKRGYLSLSFSLNMGVIKTLSGHADVVANALDSFNFSEILGTIAGEDTVFLVLREEINKEDFLVQLENLMEDLGGVE